METNHEDRWVSARLADLEPQWRPDFAHGRNLLEARLTKRRHSWSWIAAASVAALCLVTLAVPQTRAFAHQLWYRVVLNRIDVVRLDFSDLPLHFQITTNGVQEAVKDLDDAERKAGFRPYLPAADVSPTNPKLAIIGLIRVEQTIAVHDIETALRKAGAGDVQVPREWEGAQLRTGIGPMVSASYPDEVTILQARPIELSVPSGFPLERFAEVAFRSLGVSVWESRALARKFIANPAWFLDIPADEVVNIQEVSLRTGPALLIEDFDDKGRLERVTVLRSTSERIYCVTANTREAAIKFASALP
jgi:hypothetical protein